MLHHKRKTPLYGGVFLCRRGETELAAAEGLTILCSYAWMHHYSAFNDSCIRFDGMVDYK